MVARIRRICRSFGYANGALPTGPGWEKKSEFWSGGVSERGQFGIPNWLLNYYSRWWFHIFLIFIPKIGEMNPIWRAYFSSGLKPTGLFLNGFFLCKNPIVLAKDFKTNPIWTVKQLNLQGAQHIPLNGRERRKIIDSKSDGFNLGGGFKHCLFSPHLGKIPILTNIFQRGWNHQLVMGYVTSQEGAVLDLGGPGEMFPLKLLVFFFLEVRWKTRRLFKKKLPLQVEATWNYI